MNQKQFVTDSSLFMINFSKIGSRIKKINVELKGKILPIGKQCKEIYYGMVNKV